MAGSVVTARTAAVDGVLRDVFGFPSFRPGQREIINALIAGPGLHRDHADRSRQVAHLPTDPRIIGGTTLVVSPLIALMKDQVDGLAEIGMRATFLNSSLDPAERRTGSNGCDAANTSWCTPHRRVSRRPLDRLSTESTYASSPSMRRIASVSGVTTFDRRIATSSASRRDSACRCWR